MKSLKKNQLMNLMTKSDYKYFNKAKENAMLSDYYKTQVGCVAVYHDRLSVPVVIVIKHILFKNIITDTVNIQK